MTEGVSAAVRHGYSGHTMIWITVHSVLILMLDKGMVYRTHNHSRREEAAQNDDLDGIIEG